MSTLLDTLFDGTTSTSTSTSGTSTSTSPTDLLIVGGTIAALIVAGNALRTTTRSVTMVVEGDNYAFAPNTDDHDFGDVAITQTTMLQSYPVYYVMNSGGQRLAHIDLPDGGMCTEAIATYPSVVNQPLIIDSRTVGEARKAVERLTQYHPNTTAENNVVSRVASYLNLRITTDVVSEGGSIYGCHYVYTTNSSDDAPRYTGLRMLNNLMATYPSRFRYYTNANNLQFSNIGSGRMVTLNFNYVDSRRMVNNITISGELLLRGTIYDNVRVASTGNLPTLLGYTNQFGRPGTTLCAPYPSTLLPAMYQAIVSLPLGGDVQTGQVYTMTVPLNPATGGYCGRRNGWVVDFYTTQTYLRTKPPQYAAPGKTLLIIEAINTALNHEFYYDGTAYYIQMAEDRVERNYYDEFRMLVQQIVNAFQVSIIVPTVEISATPSGIQSDVVSICMLTKYLPNTFVLINECIGAYGTAGLAGTGGI